MEYPPLSADAVGLVARRLTDEFEAVAGPAPSVRHTEQLVVDVAARLRPVCAQLDDESFAALVVDVVRVKLRDEAFKRGPAWGIDG